MLKKKTHIDDNDIDLIDLLKKCWNYKSYLIIITLCCVIISGIYSSTKSKESSSKIRLVSPNFLPVNSPDLKYESGIINSEINYFIHFNFYLKSSENFSNFLKSKNYQFENKEYIGIKEIKNSDNFSIIFTRNIDGVKIFNEYIEFTKQKSRNNLIEKIKIDNLNMIKNLERSIKLAEKINLISPQILNMYTIDNARLPLKLLNNTSFYLGTTVLKELLEQRKKELAEIESLEFNHDPILLYPEASFKIGLSLKNYLINGFIIGLCLSFLTIFLLIVSKNRS
tara:strand:- start:22891 stop:23736 length:846 start_codon:yes stop_codon:yes gene_type:complete